MVDPAPQETLAPLSFNGPPPALTTRQLKRLELRGRERRRITPQAFALRVRAVGVARQQHDRWAMVGALEDLASASMAWANHIRQRGL